MSEIDRVSDHCEGKGREGKGRESKMCAGKERVKSIIPCCVL